MFAEARPATERAGVSFGASWPFRIPKEILIEIK